MAFLFKSKKKEKDNDSEKPPEPPKPEMKESSVNVTIPKEAPKPADVEKNDEHKNAETLMQTAKSENKETQSFADFDIEEELKELESKLVKGGTDKNSEEPVAFEEMLKATSQKESSEQEIESKIHNEPAENSIIIYSSKEQNHFIKEANLQWLIEQINEILALNNSLKELAGDIHLLVSNNRENVETILKNGDAMFNKSIKCDAIIRGEKNG